MSTLTSIQPSGNRVQRVVLEMSLKPFMRVDSESVTQVCREVFRQWYPLLKTANECSLLLWVADGSEILVWNNRLEDEVEWARYIGFCNGKYEIYHGMGADHPRSAELYIPDPPVITFGDLKRIISTLKSVAANEFGLMLTVGETFDPGPEFAHSTFKYETHKEIIGGGPASQIGPSFPMVNAWSRLDEDGASYAGYPDGISAGTRFGEFFGRQCKSFLSAMGFDYLWLSNGFGFSHFAWSFLGVNFDGDQFGLAEYKETETSILTYWNDFKKECPDIPVEVRGTNFAMSMDLSSDLTPYKAIYEGDFVRLPPPNSPWGPLNKDFGLEMIGFMSRIAVLPDKHFLFRYYPNDPWFWQNPWWDWYNREPFDIYCPMSVGRINGHAEIENPQVLQFLTIDTEKGILDERCPLEVIPHIRRGIDDYPNQPGVLTWLYPFDEYHTIAESNADQIDGVFFGDWYARSAVNNGLPLNTILSTRDFASIAADGQTDVLKYTVIFTPTTILEGTYEDDLINFIESGGRVILYGPLESSPEPVRQLLNITIGSTVAGETTLTGGVQYDELHDNPYDNRAITISHEATACGGGLTEIIADKNDPTTKVLTMADCGGEQRVYAICRGIPDWNGGAVGWIRGSNPFTTKREPGQAARVPRKLSGEGYDSSEICRVVLSELGYSFRQCRKDLSTRPALTFVSRRNNAYHFTGYCPDTTVALRFNLAEGAPILTGKETTLVDGETHYQLERSYHHECRVLVTGATDSTISCTETPPFPSTKPRRIVVSGAANTSLVFLAPPGSAHSVSIESDSSNVEAKRVDDSYFFNAVSDEIAISW